MSNFQKVFYEGRLIRHLYSEADAQGRELLCALTALTGDSKTRPEICPAALAPKWVAHLLPWIDDAGTEQAWSGHMQRLAAISDQLHLLGRRADLRCRRVAVLAALPNAGASAPQVRAVLRLLNRAISGSETGAEKWTAVAKTAEKVAEAIAADSAIAAGAAAAARAAGANLESRRAAANAIISAILDIFEDEISAARTAA